MNLSQLIERYWSPKAFWFGFRETLTLRIVFDPGGHRRDFIALKRSLHAKEGQR